MKKCFTIITLFILCYHSFAMQKKYYNSVVVITGQLKLSHGQILKRGDYAQLILDKCTEEGMFIKVKNDSDLVYMKDVENVVFPNMGVEVKDLLSGKVMLLKRNTPLILMEINKKICRVSFNGNEFIIKKHLISFSNREFYNSILEK